MPTPLPPPPAYRKHSGRNLAIVTLSDTSTGQRRNYYLGVYDTPESREKYHRLIAAWEAKGRCFPDVAAEPNPPAAAESSSLTIDELVLAYKQWAKCYYCKAHLQNLTPALRLLRQMYGTTPAAQFGPNKLRLVRDGMIAGDLSVTPPRRPWSRPYVNAQTHRIIAAFKWAASHEMLPASVYQQLSTVGSVKRGRTKAHEPEAVRPVEGDVVTAVRPFLSRQINALIDLQRLSGCRGGELFRLRRCDIDRSHDVWTYTPEKHKTTWRGKARTIFFGPKAQRVLAPFLMRPDDAYLFSPAEAERERRREQNALRVTPPHLGNTPGSNVKGDPKRSPGEHYTKDSYGRAIYRACVKAFPVPAELKRLKIPTGKKRRRWESKSEWRKRLGEEKWAQLRQWIQKHRWHPHQLRHSAATEIRRQFGLEAAQVALGHSSALVTDAVYAERDMAKVEEIMLKIG